MYLCLLLYSGMHLSLFPGLCWWLLCAPNRGAIGGFLKLHPPQRLLIICIINIGGLEIYLSAQINPDILGYCSEEATIGEYMGRALTTWYHVHHHQISHVNPFPRQNGVHEECLKVGDLISMSASW